MIGDPSAVMVEEPKFNRLTESAVVAVIETDLVSLTEKLDEYRDYLAECMLALDDVALSQMGKVKNCTEAFMKGWRLWKRRDNEQAFKTFRNIMST